MRDPRIDEYARLLVERSVAVAARLAGLRARARRSPGR